MGRIGESDTNVPWHEVQFILLGKADDDGRLHDFGDVVPGMYVEAINLDGSGHGLYVIEDKSTAPVRTGLTVKPVHSTGHPNGKAVIKVFKMAEAANPVTIRKSGDIMTGKLEIKSNTFDALIDKGNGTNSNSIFYVQDGQTKTKFRVRGNGQVQAGVTADSAFMATEDHDLTTKKYVDDEIKKFISGAYGAPYKYRGTDQKAENLKDGEFFVSTANNNIYASHKDLLGRNIISTAVKTKNIYPAYLKFIMGLERLNI